MRNSVVSVFLLSCQTTSTCTADIQDDLQQCGGTINSVDIIISGFANQTLYIDHLNGAPNFGGDRWQQTMQMKSPLSIGSFFVGSFVSKLDFPHQFLLFSSVVRIRITYVYKVTFDLASADRLNVKHKLINKQIRKPDTYVAYRLRY